MLTALLLTDKTLDSRGGRSVTRQPTGGVARKSFLRSNLEQGCGAPKALEPGPSWRTGRQSIWWARDRSYASCKDA